MSWQLLHLLGAPPYRPNRGIARGALSPDTHHSQPRLPPRAKLPSRSLTRGDTDPPAGGATHTPYGEEMETCVTKPCHTPSATHRPLRHPHIWPVLSLSTTQAMATTETRLHSPAEQDMPVVMDNIKSTRSPRLEHTRSLGLPSVRGLLHLHTVP